MTVLIIGGGIAGLAAAIGLKNVGMQVQVFEQAGEIREIGSGIGLFANGIQALHHLGVEFSAFSDAHWIKSGVVYDHSGRELFNMPGSAAPRGMLGLAAVVYRPELIQVLADAVGPDQHCPWSPLPLRFPKRRSRHGYV